MVAALMAGWVCAAAGAPADAAAADEILLDKYVASVNDVAPTAPDAVTAFGGDTLTYGLAVTSSPSLGGTEVTITDVAHLNDLQFISASTGGCTEDPSGITCVVTLDDAGATEVLLTFTVLPLEGAGEGCRQLVNQARVDAGGGTRATARSTIAVCPGDGGSAPTGEGTASGSGSGSGAAAGSGGAPDTSVPTVHAAQSLAAQLGAGLLGAAMLTALGVAAYRARPPRGALHR